MNQEIITSSLVFLDIDGVLNDHDFDHDLMSSTIHRDKVRLFNQILLGANACVVLSSAWRYLLYRNEMDLKGLDWLLRSHGMLANRLIGVTRKDEKVDQPALYTGDVTKWLQSYERGEQVTDWIASNKYKKPYVVIDDLNLGITQAGHPLVQTKSKVGLTEREVDKAIKILTKS